MLKHNLAPNIRNLWSRSPNIRQLANEAVGCCYCACMVNLRVVYLPPVHHAGRVNSLNINIHWVRRRSLHPPGVSGVVLDFPCKEFWCVIYSAGTDRKIMLWYLTCCSIAVVLGRLWHGLFQVDDYGPITIMAPAYISSLVF